ncbi:MAG: alpha/beta hydrolase [Verrucomicrobiota bacterium]
MSTTHLAQSGSVSDEFKDGYAEVNGQRLHYVVSGKPDAPMMLFIHGAPNFSYYWEDQLAEFGKDHFAVVPDMRGYNLSSRPHDIEMYKLKYLVEDVRQLTGKLNGGKQFILVGHVWGGLICFVFTMYHPELVDKLIVCNAPHPCLFERELDENPWQQHCSNYMLCINGYGHADEQKYPETLPRDAAVKQFATGWVADQVKLGRYSEADRQKWIEAASGPGAFAACMNYYRANDINPPCNDTHPQSEVVRSFSAKAVTAGAKSIVATMPMLLVWGVKDHALPPGNLTGFGQYFTNLWFRLFTEGDHNVSQMKHREVNAEIREFLQGKDVPRVKVL